MTRPLVLVVDDSADDRRVAVRYLQRAPGTEYRVLEASSGAQALAVADAERPDVFVLDNHMGAMNGPQLIEALQKSGHGEAAFVVLTGSSESARDFLELGTDDYIQKDELTASHLHRVVSNALIKASLRAQLQQRFAFEERLIDMVAHDLRSPLSSITTCVELLRQETLTEQGSKVVESAKRSAGRMTRIIEQLLDLARVRHAQGFPLQAEDLDLCELVHRTVEEVRVYNEGRNIEVVCQGDGTGSFDPTALAQVVSNLVGNALRYGDPTKPIRVRADAGDDTVVLKVSNAGEPIPAQSLSNLFAPFERAGREKKDRDGLGLGLYIVLAIVRAHGGEVQAESSHETTTFTVTLPRQRPAVPAPQG